MDCQKPDSQRQFRGIELRTAEQRRLVPAGSALIVNCPLRRTTATTGQRALDGDSSAAGGSGTTLGHNSSRHRMASWTVPSTDPAGVAPDGSPWPTSS